MNNRETELAIVKSHANQLAEHFESVQIFVTRHIGDEQGTVRINYGSGNAFARYGQVRQWLIQEDAYVNKDAST